MCLVFKDFPDGPHAIGGIIFCTRHRRVQERSVCRAIHFVLFDPVQEVTRKRGIVQEIETSVDDLPSPHGKDVFPEKMVCNV